MCLIFISKFCYFLARFMNLMGINALSDIVLVSAGKSHSLAISKDGKVFGWGRGQNGVLGLGNGDNTHTSVLKTYL